jgi:translation initiation factor IF-2
MPKTTAKTAQAMKSVAQTRPPIVVVMGHIDHGKSTLLDYIRKTKVCAGEAGGITQHMGAYQAVHSAADGKKHPITFLDTPGHEAFCSIRSRGAQAADIAILVVSAEDGVKPQTLDALKAIKSQKIPYIVAINKIDKPNANIDRTKTSLGENEIYVEGWGGDIPCVAISSTKGDGIPELLDMIILMAEISDLATHPEALATGIVVESEMNQKTGISATLLIKDGTLNVGDYVVAGSAFAPVRFIDNFKGEKIKTATASMPAFILGWNAMVACGLPFKTFQTKKEAEKCAEENATNQRNTKLKNQATTTLSSDPSNTIYDETSVVILPIIIKADTDGSLEGIKYELAKIKHDKVKIKIVAEGIGDINENDVKIAMGDPKVLVIGFHVRPDTKTVPIIERSAIPLSVQSFDIIYKLSEFVKEKLTALIPKEYIEEVTGRAKILALFSKEKDRQVVGGKVETGTMNSGNEVRIMRRSEEIGRGKIRELQSKKVRVSEVAEGFEFGTMIEAKIEIAVGDRIESVRTVEKVN